MGLEHFSTIVEFLKKNGVYLVGIHGQDGLEKKNLFNEVIRLKELKSTCLHPLRWVKIVANYSHHF
jgi:hypothetical protein